MVLVSRQAIAETGAQTKHYNSQYMLIKTCRSLLLDEGLCVHILTYFVLTLLLVLNALT